MVKRFFLLFILIFLSSCVTERELLSEVVKSEMVLDNKINAIYSNVNVGIQTKINLADLLLRFNRIKFDDQYDPSLDSLETKIEYDGAKKLSVIILDSNSITHRFDLKVKNKGNYLSLQRKLFLIPIPFFFYVHKERKAILFNDKNGDLHLVNGEDDSLWILMAAGSKFTNHNKFKKNEVK